jgi:amino acid transporter
MALKRSLGLSGLVFYGTGTILGAGIFVVVGEVLGEAGPLAPFAYALAGFVAFLTALSFAEMGARVPSAGGPISYAEEAFGGSFLPAFSGWAIITANTVSAATITTGFVSYLSSFVSVPGWLVSLALLGLVGAVAIAGMKQAAWFMTITTLIGVATLATIVWLSRDTLQAWPQRLGPGGEGEGCSAPEPHGAASWRAVSSPSTASSALGTCRKRRRS